MPIAHSADGAQLYYESHGRGPALLLLAGQCCDHREWTRVAQDFATQFQVIVWDYRGTGQSDKPPAPAYSTRGFAADASVVTVVGIAGTVEVNDSDSQTAADMAQTFAQSMLIAGVAGGSGLLGGGEPLCILPPEWVDMFHREGYDKQKTRAAIWERAWLPVDKLAPAMRARRMAAGADPAADVIRVAEKPDDIMIVVAGGVGRKAAYAPTWGGTTKAVSRAVKNRN
jgi:pimeloyl-ACP methyl ester carboxylesterase